MVSLLPSPDPPLQGQWQEYLSCAEPTLFSFLFVLIPPPQDVCGDVKYVRNGSSSGVEQDVP